MTVLPGFIDAHRHIMGGNDEQWFKEQSARADAGVSGGGLYDVDVRRRSVSGIVELKSALRQGR